MCSTADFLDADWFLGLPLRQQNIIQQIYLRAEGNQFGATNVRAACAILRCSKAALTAAAEALKKWKGATLDCACEFILRGLNAVAASVKTAANSATERVRKFRAKRQKSALHETENVTDVTPENVTKRYIGVTSETGKTLHSAANEIERETNETFPSRKRASASDLDLIRLDRLDSFYIKENPSNLIKSIESDPREMKRNETLETPDVTPLSSARRPNPDILPVPPALHVVDGMPALPPPLDAVFQDAEGWTPPEVLATCQRLNRERKKGTTINHPLAYFRATLKSVRAEAGNQKALNMLDTLDGGAIAAAQKAQAKAERLAAEEADTQAVRDRCDAKMSELKQKGIILDDRPHLAAVGG